LYTTGSAICFGEDKEELLFSTPLSSHFPSSFPSTTNTVSMENPPHATQIHKLKPQRNKQNKTQVNNKVN
jgi:hypothetical protein